MPAWSPDGAFLATSYATEEGEGERYDIFRLWDTRAFLAPRARLPSSAPASSALAGEAIAPEPAPLSLPLMLEALKASTNATDERLINLRILVGPDAVATDPGLLRCVWRPRPGNCRP